MEKNLERLEHLKAEHLECVKQIQSSTSEIQRQQQAIQSITQEGLKLEGRIEELQRFIDDGKSLDLENEEEIDNLLSE
jgi:hypothetical protein